MSWEELSHLGAAPVAAGWSVFLAALSTTAFLILSIWAMAGAGTVSSSVRGRSSRRERRIRGPEGIGGGAAGAGMEPADGGDGTDQDGRAEGRAGTQKPSAEPGDPARLPPSRLTACCLATAGRR